jgi:hypothetical protein
VWIAVRVRPAAATSAARWDQAGQGSALAEVLGLVDRGGDVDGLEIGGQDRRQAVEAGQLDEAIGAVGARVAAQRCGGEIGDRGGERRDLDQRGVHQPVAVEIGIEDQVRVVAGVVDDEIDHGGGGGGQRGVAASGVGRGGGGPQLTGGPPARGGLERGAEPSVDVVDGAGAGLDLGPGGGHGRVGAGDAAGGGRDLHAVAGQGVEILEGGLDVHDAVVLGAVEADVAGGAPELQARHLCRRHHEQEPDQRELARVREAAEQPRRGAQQGGGAAGALISIATHVPIHPALPATAALVPAG